MAKLSLVEANLQYDNLSLALKTGLLVDENGNKDWFKYFELCRAIEEKSENSLTNELHQPMTPNKS